MCSKFTIEVIASCGFGLEAHAFTDEHSMFVENSRKIFEISLLQQLRFAVATFAPHLNKIAQLS